MVELPSIGEQPEGDDELMGLTGSPLEAAEARSEFGLAVLELPCPLSSSCSSE